MNDQQSIERQEREFTELLEKVMQAPLLPITASVREVQERIEQLEEQISRIHDDLSGLSIGARDTLAQIRSLKSITEEIPGQVCDVLQPPVEKLQGQLKQLEDEVQQHVHQLVSDFAGQLVLIERQVVKQVIRLTESIAASQGAMEYGQRYSVGRHRNS